MKWKIIFLIFVLFLVVGAGCDESEDAGDDNKEISEIDTENKEGEFYDGLDDALAELDEIENV